MIDLARAVEDLVRGARSQADPRELRGTIEKVLSAFDGAGEPARAAALRSIGRALESVEGRGGQVLALALGALVESGASPELAWPFGRRRLEDLLHRATRFASAVVRRMKDEDIATAMEAAGAEIAKKKPREADAWRAVPARCLAVVACLTRSKELRAEARKDDALLRAAWPLSEAVTQVGDLVTALRIVDDETLLVLAPHTGAGWRVAVDGMASNGELYVLLADALLGDPRKGQIASKRPDPRAVLSIREGKVPKKGPPVVPLPFHLLAWTAVDADGSLPPAEGIDTDQWIWSEGLPADIPSLDHERIVLLHETVHALPVPAERSFEALRPDLRVVAELSPAEVVRTMVKLARAAAQRRPKPIPKTKPAARRKTAAKRKASAPRARTRTAPTKTPTRKKRSSR